MVPNRVRGTRTVWAGLVSSVVATILVVVPSTQAHAGPSVQEIEAQIAQIWNESEPLIEQYNQVHEKFQANQAKQAELAAQIAPLQRQVELAQARIGAIAAQAYQSGSQSGALTALLTSGTPRDLADQLSFLDTLARSQERQVHDVSAMKAQFDTQKAPIDQLVADLAAQDKDLTAKKQVIEAKLSQLQELRRQAYGTTSGTGSYRPWPCPATYAPTPGYTAAAFACAQAGIPYVWAAEGPNGYDCSGLTLAAWRQVGVYMPHNAAEQRRSMPYVDRANLQLGDLVFYYSDIHHVAIYVGDNKVMQAPNFGDYVRMSDMDQVGPIHSFGRPG